MSFSHIGEPSMCTHYMDSQMNSIGILKCLISPAVAMHRLQLIAGGISSRSPLGDPLSRKGLSKLYKPFNIQYTEK